MTSTAVELTRDQIVAIASVIATIVVGLGSWFVSAYYAKKSLNHEELSYRMKMTPLLSKILFKEADKLD
jgi:uncharacterized membrane protein